METFSNLVLIIAIIISILYSRQISARLQKFSRLENEMGEAIAMLSQEVEQMTHALSKAQQVITKPLSERGSEISVELTSEPSSCVQAAVQRPKVIRRERPMRREAGA